MKPPFHFRKDIPFYYNKSEKEFSQDPYEKYDPSVIRQSMIHLSDDLWDVYPMQVILDYIHKNTSENVYNNIVELGCGVGRCIAEIANNYPEAKCWGIDYSYQMLKKAKETWIDEKPINIDFSKFGFPKINPFNINQSSKNLHFGLTKAEDLPFDDLSQDLVFSSFLFDRLENPILGIKEMKRILSKNGKLIIVSPLNYVKAENWEAFYPENMLKVKLKELGFNIVSWDEDIIIREPMDKRGNAIHWNCLGIVCTI